MNNIFLLTIYESQHHSLAFLILQYQAIIYTVHAIKITRYIHDGMKERFDLTFSCQLRLVHFLLPPSCNQLLQLFHTRARKKIWAKERHGISSLALYIAVQQHFLQHVVVQRDCTNCKPWGRMEISGDILPDWQLVAQSSPHQSM